MAPEDLFMELIRDIANELNVNQLCHKILVNVCVLVSWQKYHCCSHFMTYRSLAGRPVIGIGFIGAGR